MPRGLGPTNSSKASDRGKGPDTQEDPHKSVKLLGCYYRDNVKSIAGISAGKTRNCKGIFKKSLVENDKGSAGRSQTRGRETIRKNFNNASKNMQIYVFSQNEGKHFCCVICFSVFFKGLKWLLFTR